MTAPNSQAVEAAALPDTVAKALRTAFSLGQTYWQQADSEYTSQHKKADVTRHKFQTLVDETVAALSLPQEVAVAESSGEPMARQLIISSLVASKGWTHGYAGAFVDDFAASRAPVALVAEPEHWDKLRRLGWRQYDCKVCGESWGAVSEPETPPMAVGAGGSVGAVPGQSEITALKERGDMLAFLKGLTKTRGYICLRAFIKQMEENGTACDDDGDATDELVKLADAIAAAADQATPLQPQDAKDARTDSVHLVSGASGGVQGAGLVAVQMQHPGPHDVRINVTAQDVDEIVNGAPAPLHVWEYTDEQLAAGVKALGFCRSRAIPLSDETVAGVVYDYMTAAGPKRPLTIYMDEDPIDVEQFYRAKGFEKLPATPTMTGQEIRDCGWKKQHDNQMFIDHGNTGKQFQPIGTTEAVILVNGMRFVSIPAATWGGGR